MALIKCPDCNNDVSDKAVACPKCGFPVKEHIAKKRISKRKKKKEPEVEIVPDPRFPSLPENLDLGKAKFSLTYRCNFYGDFKSGDCLTFVFLLTQKIWIQVREKGIRLTETEGNRCDPSTAPTLDIHFVTLISLNKSNLTELYSYVENDHELDPLSERTFCSQPFDFEDEKLLEPYMKKNWDRTHLLVINYWELEYKQLRTLIIRGRERMIVRFIEAVNEIKSQFDKKSDFSITLK